MNTIDPQKTKNIVNEFFQSAGLFINVEVKEPKESMIPINLTTDDAQLLIGARGQTLFEIQNLIKLIIRKQFNIKEQFFVDMDINDYKKKKAEFLKEIAQTTADEVVLTNKPKELIPMSAYERRIVHMVLAERNDVVSESTGEGAYRRIVIRQV